MPEHLFRVTCCSTVYSTSIHLRQNGVCLRCIVRPSLLHGETRHVLQHMPKRYEIFLSGVVQAGYATVAELGKFLRSICVVGSFE